MEITINNTEYISIGSYADNSDGIMSYWPKDSSGWTFFFNYEDPIIILWTLSYLASEDFDYSEVLSKLHNFLKNDEITVSFLKKYCWENDLGPMFIDFIFGEYSEYGREEFPEIIFENEVVDQENFEFDSYVFIKQTDEADFINSLDKVTHSIGKNFSF